MKPMKRITSKCKTDWTIKKLITIGSITDFQNKKLTKRPLI